MSYHPHRKANAFTGKTKAGIFKSGTDGWLKLVTPYDESFLDDFRSIIQPSGRMWNPTLKVWLVQEMFLAELVDLVKLHFDEYETDLLDEPKHIVKPENIWTFVLDSIPKDSVKSVFRFLANAVHPDKGGTEEQMKLLNLAYDEWSEKNK